MGLVPIPVAATAGQHQQQRDNRYQLASPAAGVWRGIDWNAGGSWRGWRRGGDIRQARDRHRFRRRWAGFFADHDHDHGGVVLARHFRFLHRL